MLPEKNEVGVVSRGDRMEAILSIPLRPFAKLLKVAKDSNIDVAQIFEGHRLGLGPDE